ncbi:hypothetical protein EXIGLDRAFT_768642 [Exidia glandulosa HHB12029]|uniref:Uncharacterized protein n=1 Tax=Exidia glandulosa HHB12029 TaxID=1314781 RepID=A0A165I2S3_EXIGL|nr:hypothetical protein EXIGLDRAFT_768642 [Exidia glandulosa HHB12029]
MSARIRGSIFWALCLVLLATAAPTEIPTVSGSPQKEPTPIINPTRLPHSTVSGQKEPTPIINPTRLPRPTNDTPHHTQTSTTHAHVPSCAAPVRLHRGKRSEELDARSMRPMDDFVGYHMTWAETAEDWQNAGNVTQEGGSFAYAAIGEGFYVSDTIDGATFMPNNPNARYKAMDTLCAILAHSPNAWHGTVEKVWLPDRFASEPSPANADLIVRHLIPDADAVTVPRLSLRDKSTRSHQLVLPINMANQFAAVCLPMSDLDVKDFTTYPRGAVRGFNYATLRKKWHVYDGLKC